MRNKILITGASGHLGQTLLKEIDNTQSIVLTSRQPKKSEIKNTDWILFDLENPIEINLNETKAIYHLASSTVKYNPKIDVAGTKNLLAQAVKSGVEHFIYISIVGVDKLPIKYFKIKHQTELEIEKSGIPYTILRATQFFPFFQNEVTKYLKLPIGFLPTKILYQPIETKLVAKKLIEIGKQGATNKVVELGGRETIELGNAAKIYKRRKGMTKFSIPIPLFILGNLGNELKKGTLTTNEKCMDSLTWEEWLSDQEKSLKKLTLF